MLVLSRSKEEKIFVCDQENNILLEVVVVEIRGDKARLGITAPKEYVILREEVYRRTVNGETPPIPVSSP